MVSHLTEKGYLMKPKGTRVEVEQIAGEVDMHDNMITALVELLEEKGQVGYSEWERHVKKKIANT